MCRLCFFEELAIKEKEEQQDNALCELHETLNCLAIDSQPLSNKKKTNQKKKNNKKGQDKTKKKDEYAAFPNTAKPKRGMTMQDILAKQLDGKQYVKLNKLGSIYLIPGENPNYGMLCGSNIFAVGLGPKRYLIDACQLDAEKFLSNVEAFVTEQDCYFEGILLTHAHYDHMGGAFNIIELMTKLGKPIPKIYKKIDGNKPELERFGEKDKLKEHLFNISEEDNFEIIDKIESDRQSDEVKITMRAIETPGHLSDHLCFLYEEKLASKKSSTFHMFTGDAIIGEKSTYFEDYVEYYQSLVKTQKIVKDLKVQKLFVAHSNTLYPKDIVFDAPAKVQAYVDRRNRKDKELEEIANYLDKKMGAFTIQDFYKAQMNWKVKKNPKKEKKLTTKLDLYFITMLERQIQKQVADGKLIIKDIKIAIDNGKKKELKTYMKSQPMARM